MGEEINIDKIITKNSAIAPGLTIVFWGREDHRIIIEFENIRRKLNEEWDNHIWWYDNNHIHATITALTRTKYEQFTPIKRSQVPPNLHEAVNLLSRIDGIEVILSKLIVKTDGQIQFFGEVKDQKSQANLQNVRKIVSDIDQDLKYLDEPKNKKNFLHINLGYLKNLPAVGLKSFANDINELTIFIGSASIVHYLRRTLEQKYILGQVHVPIDGSNELLNDYDFFYDLLCLK